MALCINTFLPLYRGSCRLNLQACEHNTDQKLDNVFNKYLCCHTSDLLVNTHSCTRTAAMAITTNKSAVALQYLLKTVVTAAKGLLPKTACLLKLRHVRLACKLSSAVP